LNVHFVKISSKHKLSAFIEVGTMFAPSKGAIEVGNTPELVLDQLVKKKSLTSTVH